VRIELELNERFMAHSFWWRFRGHDRDKPTNPSGSARETTNPRMILLERAGRTCALLLTR
jgi:hypothetical protein